MQHYSCSTAVAWVDLLTYLIGMKTVALLLALVATARTAPIAEVMPDDPMPIPPEFNEIIQHYIKPSIAQAKQQLHHDCNSSLSWPPAPPPPPSNASNISAACDLYNLGFSGWTNNVSRNVFTGLQDARAPDFLNILATQIQIPAAVRPAWVKALNSILTADQIPALFTSISCAPDKQKLQDTCRFVVMLGEPSLGVNVT